MGTQMTNLVTNTPANVWMKKLSWALPLLFLIKGLLWVTVPFISAIYVLN